MSVIFQLCRVLSVLFLEGTEETPRPTASKLFHIWLYRAHIIFVVSIVSTVVCQLWYMVLPDQPTKSTPTPPPTPAPHYYEFQKEIFFTTFN